MSTNHQLRSNVRHDNGRHQSPPPHSLVHKLPLEVLQAILRLIGDPDDSPFCEDDIDDCDTIYPTIIEGARLVCRTWNRAILADPHIWSHINYHWGQGWLDGALQRSKSVPLTVTCVYEGDASDSFPIVDFLGTLQTNIHRIENLTLLFEVPNHFRPSFQAQQDAIALALARLLLQPAPKLEKVCLSVAGWFQPTRRFPFNLFNHQAPCLKEIEFVDSLLPYRSLGLTSLDTLAMDDSWAPSLTNLLHLIQHCPELTSLSITALDTNTLVTVEDEVPTIYLASLKNLEVRGLLQDGLENALHALRAPNCKSLAVDVNMRGRPLDDLLGQEIYRTVYASLQRAESASIKLSPPNFHLAAEGVHVELLHVLDRLAALQTLLQPHYAYPTITTLKLLFNGTTPALLAILTKAFPNLKKLEIDCQTPFQWRDTLESLLEIGNVWPRLESVSFSGSKRVLECGGEDLQYFMKGLKKTKGSPILEVVESTIDLDGREVAELREELPVRI